MGRQQQDACVFTCSTVVGPTPEVVEVVLLSPNKGSEVVSNHVSVVANGAVALVVRVGGVGVGFGLVTAEVLAGGGEEGSRLRWRLEEARVEGGGGGKITAVGGGGENESSNGS